MTTSVISCIAFSIVHSILLICLIVFSILLIVCGVGSYYSIEKSINYKTNNNCSSDYTYDGYIIDINQKYKKGIIWITIQIFQNGIYKTTENFNLDEKAVEKYHIWEKYNNDTMIHLYKICIRGCNGNPHYNHDECHAYYLDQQKFGYDTVGYGFLAFTNIVFGLLFLIIIIIIIIAIILVCVNCFNIIIISPIYDGCIISIFTFFITKCLCLKYYEKQYDNVYSAEDANKKI